MRWGISPRGWCPCHETGGPGGMRVLLSPGAEALARGLEVAEALAGSRFAVAMLSERGVRNLRRPLSRSEVQVVRAAVAGDELLVGYVCAGTALPGGCPADVRSVVVTDHVNLTWRSPLTGPNDERFGPVSYTHL